MCGIAGYLGHDRISISRIEATLDLMRQRGPDNRSHRSWTMSNGMNVTLLHSRLSIVDLEPRSNQPFECDGCALVFNGEIYNYIEVRKELQNKGRVFHTTSDTEVLMHAYLEYGEECVSYMEGMWAFAIWDSRRQVLFLSRDRFAEKPLFHIETPDGFYFGSEVKLLRSLSGSSFPINRKHLLRYMVNGYKSLYKTPETFFIGVHEVPFAANMVIENSRQPVIRRYWIPQYAPQKMTLPEAVEQFKHALLESIRIRLRADVPLAFCLSGGVDSSAIVSIAAKCFGYHVSTFSILDTDERYNERDNIEETLKDLNCPHTLIETSRDNFFERLAGLIRYHDGPVSTISYYIHSFLSEAIAKQGYRVVCSGTAADELVTGYYDHFNLHLYDVRNSPNYPRYLQEWRDHTGSFVRNPHLKNPELYFDQPDFRRHIYLDSDKFAALLKAPFDEPFVEEHYCENLLRNRMLNELFHEGTRVILHEDDLNSMMYSIENRSPYLDSRLFAVAYSIPNEWLIQEGFGKYVLREAVSGILNEKVRLDRRKRGFNASINSLVDFNDPDIRAIILSESPVYELVDRKKLEPLMAQAPMPNSISKFMFNFLNVKLFLELFA